MKIRFMFRLLRLDFMPNKEATCISMRGSREREREGGGQGGQEPNLFMQSSNFSKLYYKMNNNLHMPLTSPLANLFITVEYPPREFFSGSAHVYICLLPISIRVP